jgi:hypothetical protein
VHARKRGVESFEKGEKDVKRGKIKRKVCVWERKKEKIYKSKEKYVYERMKEKKKRKRKEK